MLSRPTTAACAAAAAHPLRPVPLHLEATF
jgi:hypothetical protein